MQSQKLLNAAFKGDENGIPDSETNCGEKPGWELITDAVSQLLDIEWSPRGWPGSLSDKGSGRQTGSYTETTEEHSMKLWLHLSRIGWSNDLYELVLKRDFRLPRLQERAKKRMTLSGTANLYRPWIDRQLWHCPNPTREYFALGRIVQEVAASKEVKLRITGIYIESNFHGNLQGFMYPKAVL